MNEKTHLDLFSGIGGFALAAQWAGFRTIGFCECDPYCQAILKARFGAVAVTDAKRCDGGANNQGQTTPERDWTTPGLHGDIFALRGADYAGVGLITGGFPCQPFSLAGKRTGKADDRYIWPEMRRVIAEARPRWVLAENVPGIIGMELDQVLSDLEAEGYACGALVIPACAVDAPHRRDRVWIVAHHKDIAKRGLSIGEDAPNSRHCVSDRHAPDAAKQGSSHRRGSSLGEPGEEPQPERRNGNGPSPQQFDIPWIEVAARFCRVDDGIPAWVHARRVARLKALGNAIVPAVAYEIIKSIAEIENGNKTR